MNNAELPLPLFYFPIILTTILHLTMSQQIKIKIANNFSDFALCCQIILNTDKKGFLFILQDTITTTYATCMQRIPWNKLSLKSSVLQTIDKNNKKLYSPIRKYTLFFEISIKYIKGA